MTLQRELILVEQAALESTPLRPAMSHALTMVTARVPASLALFFVGLHGAPVVVKLGPESGSNEELERAYRHYMEIAHRHDPFVAIHFVRRHPAVATIDDVADRPAFDRSTYGRFLRGFGVHSQANLYVASGGRVIGRIVLLRAGTLPEFDPDEVNFLSVSQPLIELVYEMAWAREQQSDEFDGTMRPLTPKEADVARFAAQGATNDEIARALHVTRSTVKTHLNRVFHKLGVRSRTELASRLTGRRRPR